MHTQCSNNEPADCLNECKRRQAAGGIEEWRTYCFWWHCEAAKTPNDGFHCHHAVDPTMCGQAQFPTTDSQDVPCKFPKAFKNGACNTNDDCCSGDCVIDKGACN